MTINYLPEFQSAYHKHHGCETSLLKLTNDILWGKDNASGNLNGYHRSQCCLQHCRLSNAAKSAQPQIWNNRHSSGMVQKLPNSKKI